MEQAETMDSRLSFLLHINYSLYGYDTNNSTPNAI